MRLRPDALSAAAAVLALGAHGAGAQPPAATPAGALGAGSGALYGVVYGVVYDSLTRGPLAGARVQVARADDLGGLRAVAADSAGAFRVDALAPGRYLVGFDHPSLDLLHLGVEPRLVALAPGGDPVRVDLGVPDLAAVRPAVCGSPQEPADSSGLLAGQVRDAADGAPVAHATVVLAWAELSVGAGGVRTERRRVVVPAAPGGTYLACGVPAGVELVVSAAAPGRASGEVTLEVPPRGLLRRDLTLGDTASVAALEAPDVGAARPETARPRAGDATAAASAPVARGTARLTGTVRDPAGRPVRGARVSVPGTAAAATAGVDGAFALGGLPAGTRTLEVRALGFAPGQVAVDLAPGRVDTVGVRLARVATLAPVTAYGTPSERSLRLQEFLDRRRTSAFGRFLTEADLLRLQPPTMAWALRQIPGLKVAPNGRLGSAVIGRTFKNGIPQDCPAQVVVERLPLEPGDDVDAVVSPQQVVGVEVYIDEKYAPPQYGGPRTNGCSVVLLWTRQ